MVSSTMSRMELSSLLTPDHIVMHCEAGCFEENCRATSYFVILPCDTYIGSFFLVTILLADIIWLLGAQCARGKNF